MKKLYFTIAICLYALFNACTNQIDEDASLSKVPSQTSDITYQNGILIIKNSLSLSKIMKKEIDLSALGFTSQQDIMNKLIEEENAYAKSLRNLSDEEYDLIQKHTDTYLKLLNEKFIKVEKYQDGSELYSLNLALPNYSRVLNEKGFFAIDDTIFQITSDKMKIWINGDIDNYEFLNNVEKTDLAKDIHVYSYDYSSGLNTKAIPIIKKRDQKVAYVMYNTNNTGRVILSFYDITSLNFEEECYNRDICIRYSYQEMLDGRNFAFAQAPYNIDLSLWIDDMPGKIFLSTSSTGADDWYTIYFNLEFLNPGRQIQKIKTSEDYYLINSFVYFADTYPTAGELKHIYMSFSGRLQEGSTNAFIYNGDMGGFGSEPFIPMLPD